MAAADDRSPRSRRVTSRATNTPARQPRSRVDRRRLMVQIVAAFLVLAMLLPVIAFFF